MHRANRPLFSMEGLEKRTLLSVQTFTPPTASTALQNETLGKDGSLYFVEQDQQQIGRILPNKRIVEYTVPDSFGAIGALVTAKDGSIWFNTANGDSPLLGHLSTRGRFSAVAIHHDALSVGVASDGSIWFSTVAEGLGHLSAKGAVKYFGGPGTGGYVTKIIAGPAGGIYYTSISKSTEPDTTPYVFSVRWARLSGNQLFDVQEFSGNTAFNFAGGASIEGANNLTIGPDGNIWFYDGSSLQIEDPNLGTILGIVNRADFPGISGISSLTGGPDGKLWFVDHQNSGKIWTISVDGAVTNYDLPGGATATPFAIVTGKSKTLWVTDETNGVVYNLSASTPGGSSDSGTGGTISNAIPVPFVFGATLRSAGTVVQLVFADNVSGGQFVVERSTGPSGPYTVVGTASVPPLPPSGIPNVIYSPTSQVFNDGTVQLNTTYFYRVYEQQQNLRSTATYPISITTPSSLPPGGVIKGIIFHDTNGDGIQDNGEAVSTDTLVYIDQAKTGLYQGDDPTVYPDSNGNYAFYGLAPGSYSVRADVNLAQIIKPPVEVGLNQVVSGYDFGIGRTSSLQYDGKWIFVQNATSPDTLTRYNTNGKIDTSFGIKGIVTFAPNTFIYNVTPQPNGTIKLHEADSVSGGDIVLSATGQVIG